MYIYLGADTDGWGRALCVSCKPETRSRTNKRNEMNRALGHLCAHIG